MLVDFLDIFFNSNAQIGISVAQDTFGYFGHQNSVGTKSFRLCFKPFDVF